ncbi:MAG: DUF2334 domain-containing protein [Clostridium sp.]|jgi:hypothetical protein|uniref:DUF2334 domain-containing protein n=1 Tax=Clostridium sp. TaxID=1506 RepID=UPI0025C28841|nr:DUF2334 domain-containing protein [Clostridium sp.]MCH3964839.1 DUF2334 domain-containing protein [Clostridium sp.]MCI1716666.1 DUF2334 domain-containing protein [Clostridium sp.]MCI1800852.1 DUF2334 domain-containing protein [Clostridium sp.]MCI1814843.1 DUF2334 domain-containing protein [Clostridium sp.]MCI1871599.1 DUF2334 domain-containing protein [Clostridium sp.]
MIYNTKKIYSLSLILVVSASIIFSAAPNVESSSKNSTAIIYDTYNEFGSEENRLNSLVRLILGSGSGIDILNSSSYFKGSASKYKILFILYNNFSKLPVSLVNDLLNFKGRIVWIGKNFDQLPLNKSNIKYISSLSSQNLNYNILKNDFYRLINNTYQENRNVYLLIDAVYPFTDLDVFAKKIDFLYSNGIPFICSVMPVYENQDMDAMKRFCGILEYVQNNGGKIILHFPVLYGENIPEDKIESKIRLAQKIYMDYGIQPIALDIPEGFLYRENSKALIHSTNTVFIHKDTDMGILDLDNYSISPFNLVIDKVDFNNKYIREQPDSIHNTALSLSSDMDYDNFKKQINDLLKDEFYFSSPEYLDIPAKYAKKHSNESKSSPSRSIDISSGNMDIIKITLFICVFFVAIIIIGIKLDVKKFFR